MFASESKYLPHESLETAGVYNSTEMILTLHTSLLHNHSGGQFFILEVVDRERNGLYGNAQGTQNNTGYFHKDRSLTVIIRQ